MQSQSDKKVYILDDDRSVLTIFKKLFEHLKLNCDTFYDVKEFVEHIKSNGEPDLCYIDLNLTKECKKEGFDLISALRKYGTTSYPIVVVSRNNSAEDINRAFEVGANEFLEKPIDKLMFEYQVGRYIKSVKIKDLVLARVPQCFSACEILEEFDLVSISEECLVVNSKFYISKGCIVKLSGATIDEIFGSPLVGFSIISSEIKKAVTTLQLRFIKDDDQLRLRIGKWIRARRLHEVHS